jgi:autotransporter strand-loop-strand O-heptosyltransferase
MSQIDHSGDGDKPNSAFNRIIQMGKILIKIDCRNINKDRGVTPIGDIIAAVPYVEKYSLDNIHDQIFFETNRNLIGLLSPTYPSVKFIEIGDGSHFNYDKIIEIEYLDYTSPIQSGFARQLGYKDPAYIRPRIEIPESESPIKNKYISIGIQSSSQLKYWNHPSGKRVQPQSPYWNELCGILRKKGYTPVVVEQFESFGSPPFRNGIPTKANKKFGQSLSESARLIYHSEFYIGLSSGMSWIAHALGKKVVMISNFTEDWNEFDLSIEDYIRITNKEVCHGCWNKIGEKYLFDKKDWYWCPEHKGTERQFECHKSITPEMVINQIQHLL